MLGFLYSLITSFCFGLGSTVSKKTISENGLYRAIVYNYVGIVILLIIGAFVFNQSFIFPSDLIIPYLVQIIIGAVAVLALFKAFEIGKASILGPLSMLYVLVVLSVSIFLFGEHLSLYQILGSLLLLGSSLILAFEDLKKFKLEAGVVFLLITIFGWGYYYSFMKTFVPVLGAYMTTFYLEIGIATLVCLYSLITRKCLQIPNLIEGKNIFFRSILLFFGSLLYAYSVGELGSGLTSAIVSSSSIITAVSSYFLLKEKLDYIKYGAIIVSIIGLVAVFLG